jgi:hypothetical protein
MFHLACGVLDPLDFTVPRVYMSVTSVCFLVDPISHQLFKKTNKQKQKSEVEQRLFKIHLITSSMDTQHEQLQFASM